MSAIHHIVKETHRRIEMMHLPYEEEFRCHLKFLGFKEKEVVKESFLRQEWNIGSSRVLRFLQEANILTATEFILSLESNDLIQSIMNDLLEAEFELLANIIRFADEETQHSRTLSNILKETFGVLLVELKENPNAIPCNYLLPLKLHLPLDAITAVKQNHLQLLLTAQDSNDPAEAISKQEQWRCEMEALRETIFGSLIVELVAGKNYFIAMLKQLLERSCVISLKYTLYVFSVISRTIGNDRKEVVAVKDLMKYLFRMAVDTGLLSKMQILLLFARELCAANETILGSYSVWYKQTIGEMTYSIKKPQFISMMEMLTATLSSETSLDILAVHSTVSISAPAKCNDYVLNYKQLCRAHISHLKHPDAEVVLDE